VKCERLLRPHHDRVDESAHRHHQAKEHVHDTDPLVIDARDPLAPEIGQAARENDQSDHAEDNDITAEPAIRGGSAGSKEPRPKPGSPIFSLCASRTDRRAASFAGWAVARRQAAGHNILKQAWLDRLVGEGTYVLAFVQMFDVARMVKPGAGFLRSGDPTRILGNGTQDDTQDEMHTGKSVAAELGGFTVKVFGTAARVFDARNHQAKTSVAAIVGTTMSSMAPNASSRIFASALPMAPCGSRTPPEHPASVKIRGAQIAADESDFRGSDARSVNEPASIEMRTPVLASLRGAPAMPQAPSLAQNSCVAQVPFLGATAWVASFMQGNLKCSVSALVTANSTAS
jgi:hypothetical protein